MSCMPWFGDVAWTVNVPGSVYAGGLEVAFRPCLAPCSDGFLAKLGQDGPGAGADDSLASGSGPVDSPSKRTRRRLENVDYDEASFGGDSLLFMSRLRRSCGMLPDSGPKEKVW